MSLGYPSRGARGAAFGLAVVLALAGAMRPARANDPSTIDWSKGDLQDTRNNCSGITFKNLADRHTYALWVRGVAPATCHFQADGLTFHYPSNSGPTATGASTLYEFRRFGTDVLVAWTPGY